MPMEQREHESILGRQTQKTLEDKTPNRTGIRSYPANRAVFSCNPRALITPCTSHISRIFLASSKEKMSPFATTGTLVSCELDRASQFANLIDSKFTGYELACHRAILGTHHAP
ncbi:hypothetical protein PGTUg99_028841 [Puccinia graminis f. sp. tritici]|uniref:Uncharacterized protein n=1 Tax=Puccinia graminis f. sp. tritici TaxID=56615 RepID=A0A5B0SM08_PUCGR|nr:hypothetical protein PGTUg99_028841 [Puccinia graminis f. sp. tritici]